MLWPRILAAAFMALALVACVMLLLYDARNYTELAPVVIYFTRGHTKHNDTDSAGMLKTSITGNAVGRSSWIPFFHRTRRDGQPDLPRILFWTKHYGHWFSDLEKGDPDLENKGCPDRCYITNDRSTLNIADAVVFYGHDLDPSLMPKQRAPFQKWVFWSFEPPWHTPVDNFKGLKQTMNWTFTYRLDSDVVDTYGEVIIKQTDFQDTYKRAMKRIWKRKSKIGVWAVSKCESSGKREHFVHELRKHIYVDVYGKCGAKQCSRERKAACYRYFAQNYYFYLSFENCICKDYVTEKLFRVLTYDIIPVVFGGANYSRMAPPGSFIDALSFRSPKDLALYLEKVAINFSLYSSYFEWKDKYRVKPRTYYTYCELCRKLYSDSFKEASVVADLLHWWNTSSRCQIWSRDSNTLQE